MEEIEGRAEEILASVPNYIWDGQELPVPVDDIAGDVFRLLVQEVENMSAAPGCPELGPDQCISGLLLTNLREIWVNKSEADQWPGRRRFTVAHEIGHWVLHDHRRRPTYCRSAFIDTGTGYEVSEQEREPKPPAEDEADAFAAALLMPASLLRHHYEHTTRDFDQLKEMFGASAKAMGKRLHTAVPRTS
jgi:hypothetical protein